MQYIEQWGALGVFIASVSDERMLVDLKKPRKYRVNTVGRVGLEPTTDGL